MRILFLAFLAAAALVGCATPLDDLLEGGYSEAAAQPAPESLVGTWTGSMGPYLVTMVVEPDGTGRYCHSWNEKNAVSRLKFDGRRLAFQDGSVASIIDLAPDKLVIHPDYSHASRAALRPDPNLVEASPYCMKALKGTKNG